MSPLLILAAAAAVGVEVGWQPLPEGGHEYTIQIEPQLLNILKRQDITSDVPPQLQVRRYRVTLGTEKLARDDGPPLPAHPHVNDEPSTAVADSPTDTAPGNATPPDVGESPRHVPAEPTVAAEPSTHDNHHPTTVETAQTTDDHGSRHAVPPGQLPADGGASKPLEAQPAAHQEPSDAHTTEKPELEPERPWTPFLVSGVLLCCSLGANLYLGWIAWEARHRYRQALSKFKAAVT
jgi:hypothetical protein